MKRTAMLLAVIMMSIFSYSQIIDIPDANFKNALVNTICVDIDNDNISDIDADINNDGEIDISEAGNIKSLYIISKSISNLNGIEFFTALQKLYCDNNKLTSLNVLNLTDLNLLICSHNQLNSLDVSNLPALETLICTNNKLTSLVVSNLPALQTLKCNQNLLTTINVTNLTALQELICYNNKLTSLVVNNLPALQKLECYGNQLTSLKISDLPALQSLDCSENQLSVLKVTNLPSLLSLHCYRNQLTSWDTFNLPVLQVLNCSNNQLNTLDVSKLSTLQQLDCSGNQLTSLDISNLTSLISLSCVFNNLTTLDFYNVRSIRSLSCFNNNLSTLDVSNLTSLIFLDCSFNQLILLNIKNGSTYISSSYIDFQSNPTFKYLCCDDKNSEVFKEKIKTNGYTNVEVNTYCSFDPGGIFSVILGFVKYNFDNNGCDISDIANPYNKISLKSNAENGYILSDENGYYNISLNAGIYTLKPEFEYPDYFNMIPDSIVVTVSDTLKDTIIQNFCITPKGILKQVDLSIIPLTPPARPGFNAKYKVVMTNKGNQVENGTLYFSYDEAKMDFVLTDVSPTSQGDGLLSWDFTDLLPFETRYYNVTLNVNSPSETPPVNAGDDLLITCNILDNVFLLRQEVVGSYDPNDKTCLEGKTITPEQVGKYVHYLIRFENTGNYAAENVVVKDVINESTFDISTLQITDASHEAWARINGNIVEFIFENIQLPYDDASNDGYICFKIKTKPTLVLGNELKNEANIYFDYNLPILTNKTNTVIALPVGTNEANGEGGIEIFTNPVRDVLKFSGDDKVLKVEIFDMSGRLVQVSNVVNGEVNVERMVSGVYVLKLYGVDKISFRKMIKN